MFYGFPTPGGTGLEIYGDYSDMSLLYSTVRLYSDKENCCEAINDGQFKMLITFAYELRKAREGERLRKEISFVHGSTNTYYGFQLVWTDALFFLHVLKHNARFIKAGKLEEAILAFIEHVITSALKEYDEEGALSIIENMGQLPVKDKHVFAIYQWVQLEFLSLQPGINRFRRLTKMLFSDLSPFAYEYKCMMEDLKQQAAAKQCRIHQLEFSEAGYIIW